MVNRLALAALLCATAATATAQNAPCIDGTAEGYPCANVDLLARLPLNATPNFNESSSDIWGWTDPDTGVEYAIINQYDHTAFVDLSTPTEPVLIGRLVAPTQAVARDVKTFGHHAVIGTDRGTAPVQIFDLTRLRDVAEPPVDFTADANYAVGLGPHNLAVNPTSGFAYLVFVDSNVCTGALHIVDLNDPDEPTYAGCYDHPGSGFHDVQCVTYSGPDADYAGHEICFGSAPGTGELVIVDVTEKQSPALIATAPYPNPSYTHQGWLTEDGRYFVMNDEGDEGTFGINTRTLVMDVSDLDEPEFAFAYDHPTRATDHNIFIRDGFAYEANYEAGFRVLSLAGIDDEMLTEVAFFDTHPEGDVPGFDGAFGVYPFFDSGIVVVSDMARGLFVLRPTFDGAAGVEPDPQAGGRLTLSAYPNPFNDSTRLTLSAERAQHVTVTAYDVFGRPVQTLFEGRIPKDEPRQIAFDGASLAAGTYLVRAVGASFSATRAVTLAR